MTLLLSASAVSRVLLFSMNAIPGNVWWRVVLTVAATALYILIALCQGREQFYKTAIPVWLLALFAAIWVKESLGSRALVWLLWISLFFFAFLYMDVVSGQRVHRVWLLFPIMLLPLTGIYYFNRQAIFQRDWDAVLQLLPNTLLFAGCTLLIFAIRISPAGEYHPTWGDRVDGRRLRSLPPANMIIPYIMVNRNGSSNLFEEQFEITGAERYIRNKRREGLTNFGMLHLFLACYCRAVAKYPGVNRFIAGQRIYSRGEDIQFCMTAKKEMSSDAPDSIFKLHLSPRDTAQDVYRKFNAAVEEIKDSPLDSDFDNTARALTLIPGVFLKFTVWLLRTMDYFGLLPGFLLEVSPFHGSVFFTSMGSLGIPAIYHHLYDFGNLPVFGAFGCKRRTNEVLADGTVVQRKYVDLKFCLDERIVDGFYYATVFKYMKRLMQHPDLLDQPPEEVVQDID